MSGATRYWLLQLPGWAFWGVVLYAVHRWVGLPGRWAWLLLGGVILKDAILFPFLRHAYEDERHNRIAQLDGARGMVKTTIAPEGYVMIYGELWRARSRNGILGEGTEIVVSGHDGMVLQVVRETQAEKKREG